jgi:hypothetical protein
MPTSDELPAIITRVHSDTCVNLEVFGGAASNKLPTSVCLEGTNHVGSSWRWPPRS